MERSLIAFDTDRIKNYVFTTGILKEIRGASAILDELNRITMPKVIYNIDPSCKEIYANANGGSGLFEVESSRAQECILAIEKKYIEKKYLKETKSGFITGVHLPCSGCFNSDFETLSLKLRLAKNNKLYKFYPSLTAFYIPALLVKMLMLVFKKRMNCFALVVMQSTRKIVK